MPASPGHARFSAIAIACAALAIALCPIPASADLYQLTTVQSTQRDNFYGIDVAGDFTVNRTNTLAGPGTACGTTANARTCFETFYVGNSSPVFSVAAPALTWDNGSLCSPVPGAGFSDVNGLCNNGHNILSALFTFANSSTLRGLWGGPNPDLVVNFLGSGSIDSGFMNSSGDAVFIDGINNRLVFADDLSTDQSPVPEPSTVVLLGTGGLTLLGALRHRLRP